MTDKPQIKITHPELTEQEKQDRVLKVNIEMPCSYPPPRSAEKLLPCPTNKPMCNPRYKIIDGLGADLVSVQCCCGRSTARHYDLKDAKNDWNSRAQPSTVPRTLAADTSGQPAAQDSNRSGDEVTPQVECSSADEVDMLLDWGNEHPDDARDLIFGEQSREASAQKLVEALKYIAQRNWLKSSGRDDAWKWINEFIEVAESALASWEKGGKQNG